MKIGLRWLKLTLLWLVTISAAGSAYGQSPSYPNKPVRLISDSSPGSAVDVGLRIIADGMSKHWNQQIVVVNQAGAAGAISARVAAQAEPDGYTLYAPALSVFLAVPGKAPNLPLMIPRDFAAVGYTVDQPLAIGVSPKLGVKTLQDLIGLAKKQPGKLSYAVTGVGRLTHLMGELLQLRTGIELQMVPYSGGSAQAFTDVIAGRIPIVMEGYSGLVGSFRRRHDPAARGGVAEASAERAEPADRRGNAARLRRLRLAGRVGAERHAGGRHQRGEQMPAHCARLGCGQGRACQSRLVRAPDVAFRGDRVHPRAAGAMEAGH